MPKPAVSDSIEFFTQALDKRVGNRPLTNRQTEVMYLIVVEGMTNLSISLMLKLSIKTIEAHKSTVRERLKYRTNRAMVRDLLERYLREKVTAELLAERTE